MPTSHCQLVSSVLSTSASASSSHRTSRRFFAHYVSRGPKWKTMVRMLRVSTQFSTAECAPASRRRRKSSPSTPSPRCILGTGTRRGRRRGSPGLGQELRQSPDALFQATLTASQVRYHYSVRQPRTPSEQCTLRPAPRVGRVRRSAACRGERPPRVSPVPRGDALPRLASSRSAGSLPGTVRRARSPGR